MPAGEAPANYYLRLLDRRLPNEQGEPLTTPLMGDFRVDNISGYFSDIAKRVRLAYEIDETAPHLPGLEPLPPTPEEIAKK